MKKWSSFQSSKYSNSEEDEKEVDFWRTSGLEQIQADVEKSIQNLQTSKKATAEDVRTAWSLHTDLKSKVRALVSNYNLSTVASRANIDNWGKRQLIDEYDREKASIRLQEDLQSLKVLKYEVHMESDPNAMRKSTFVFRLLLWPTMLWLFGIALISQNYRDEATRTYGSEAMRNYATLMGSPFFVGFSPIFIVLPRLWCYSLEIGIQRNKEYTYLNYTLWVYQIEAIFIAVTLLVSSDVSGLLGCMYFSFKVQLELGAILMWRDQILLDGHRPMLLTHMSVIVIFLLSMVFFVINYWEGYLFCWALDKPVSTFTALICAIAICGTGTTVAAHNFVLVYK